MDLGEIKDFIKNHTEKETYYEFLLGQDVWYFQDKVTDEDSLLFYDKFKRFIAEKLDLHFHNVSIIGSAKTKYSFAPDKGFREFNNESDFDIIIVSDSLFLEFWKNFRIISQTQFLKGYQLITSRIFRKFVVVKDDDPHYENEFIKDWQQKVLDFKTEFQLEFKIYNDLNYRIYSSWEDVEIYHLQGIKKLKSILNETN